MDYPWELVYINISLENKLKLPEYDNIDDTELDPNYKHYKEPLGLITIYHPKDKRKDTTNFAL